MPSPARGAGGEKGTEQTWMREVDGGNGYAAASTRRVHFGLGDVAVVTQIEVHWPSGLLETIQPPDGVDSLPLDQYLTIYEGQGIQ